MGRLTILTALVLAGLLSGCEPASVASTPILLTPEPGRIVFGRDLATEGTAVTNPATCMNPELSIAFVGKFKTPIDGVVTVEVAKDGGPSAVRLIHTLVGGIDGLHDTFRGSEFQGPAQYQFTMVLNGTELLATGTLGVDSWPPSGSC